MSHRENRCSPPGPKASASTSTRRRSAQGGYNMVVLVIAITVLHIVLAAALPLWSTVMKREREEELIFRGLQYAEAIRVFQRRFGRLPVRLEELIKVEPRCIRQLWHDPMTDGADWGLVVFAARGRRGATPPGGEAGIREEEGRDPRSSAEEPGAPGGLGRPPQMPVGPIRGVYSRSTEDSIKSFFDRRRYDEWQFTVDLVTMAAVAQQRPDPRAPRRRAARESRPARTQAPAAPGQPRLNAHLIGRPFRVAPPGQAGVGPQGTGLPRSDLPVSDPSGKRRGG